MVFANNPCPSCLHARTELEAACGFCGWHPEPATMLRPFPDPREQPSRNIAIFLGVLSFLPMLIAWTCFILLMLSRDLNIYYMDVLLLVPLNFYLILVVLLPTFVVYLFRSDAVPEMQRAFWCVALIVGNGLVFPIFWYRYIWKPSRA